MRRRSSTGSNEAVERKHGVARLGACDVEDVSVARAPVRLPAGGAVNGRVARGRSCACLLSRVHRVEFGSTVDARSPIRYHGRAFALAETEPVNSSRAALKPAQNTRPTLTKLDLSIQCEERPS